MGKYYSSTGSSFYQTKIISPGNPTITVKRTLITFQANFYSSQLEIGFSQQLYGSTAKYGFGNVYVYELLNDLKIILSGLFGLPYKCIANYYAYNGYCVQNCPPYSIKDQVNNNCTDFSQTQSKIYSNTQTQNYYGTYIVKEFYNNNFNWDTVNNLYQVILHPSNNYLNGQPFSFIGNKKILGGYSSWGWGTYGTLINLPPHSQIRLQFTLYLIDSWQAGDTFSYYIDGNPGNTYIQNSPNIQLQGLSNLDQQIVVGQKFTHTSSTLTLMFTCSITQKNSMVASCGISDLFMLIDKTTDHILCPSKSQYFSYFTNNCESCLPTATGCQLYPDYLPTPYIKCSIGCLDCQSNTICNQCDTNSGYQKVGNICSCQSGYFQQTTCKKCHYSCLECTGTSNLECTSCEITRTFLSGECYCLSNSVDVFSQSSCESIHDQSTAYCHYSCDTCFGTSYSHCLTCSPASHRLYKYWSSCPCRAQYQDVGVKICQLITCDDTCLTCDGPLESDCLSCRSNFRFESGYCICNGLYNNIVASQSCVLNLDNNQCHGNCLTCFDWMSTACLSCDITNQIIYSSTSALRYLNINAATNEQFCTCIDGYMEIEPLCELCDQTCQTCSSELENCGICRDTDHRVLEQMGDWTFCVCMDGYNDKINPGQSCVQNLTVCHYSCQTCFGLQSDQCLYCNPTYRVLNNTTCDCLTYEDHGQLQCQNCYQTCLTCDGVSINNCLTCDASLNRYLYMNQCICNLGYNDKLNTIQCLEDLNTCDQTCSTCYGLGQNQCLTCSPDRNLQENFCICKDEILQVTHFNDELHSPQS